MTDANHDGFISHDEVQITKASRSCCLCDVRYEQDGKLSLEEYKAFYHSNTY